MVGTRAGFEVAAEELEFALLLRTGGMELVPAAGVAAEVLLVILLERLERGVGRVEGDVEEPRLLRGAGFAEEGEGVVDIGDGGVEALFRDGPRLAVEAEGLVAGEVVGGAGEVAEEALEAIVGGFFREVPLAGHGGEVAGRGEDLGDGDGARHRFIAGLAAPATGEQADA